MVTDSKKLIKTSFIYAAAQIFTQGVNFLLLPVYTNKLGTVEYGKISAISAFTGLISSFIIISIQSGLCRFYQEERDKNKIVSTALNFAYILCFFLLILTLLIGKSISKFIFDFENSGQFGDGYSIFCITVITSMLNQIIGIYISKYSMEYKALKISAIQGLQIILQFSIIIVMVLKINLGIMGVLYGQLVSAAVVFIMLTLTETKNYKLTINRSLLKNMLIFSSGILPVNLAGWILTLSDRYFIKHYMGLADTGIYNLGYQFGMLINPMFITPFLNSFTAYKFEIYKNSDARDKFKNLFRKYNVIGCFIMLGISIYSKFGVMVFANQDFLEAYKVVPLILYSYFLYGKTGYYALGFQIENKTWKIGQYMIYASILNIILNFILVPGFGMYGAALSTVVSYFILNLIFIKVSNKYYKIDIDLKFQAGLQLLTAAVYGIYYAIALSCNNIAVEFIINIFIIAAYIYLLIKMNFVDYELKNFIIKAGKKILKKIRNNVSKFKDMRVRSHSAKEKHISYSYIDVKALDTSKLDKKTLEYLCQGYMAHYFDLLGSGRVNVSYDMNCPGLEGYVYNGSLHINVFDKDGAWLGKIMGKPCLKWSQKIWKHIESGYEPIDWQMDFKSGFRYSLKKWYLDQPIGVKPGVDIKVPWELCRLQHLPSLALYAWVFKEKRKIILVEFKNQVLDFIMANPVKRGAAWTCTMDTGIRAANMLTAFDIFRQMDEYNILDEFFIKTFNSSIYEHGCFIIKNLEVNEKFTGNHYLSDIIGLLFISAYLKRDEEIDSWLSFSVHELIFQCLKQFYADGTNFEASTSYHRLSGELLAYSTALVYGMLETDKEPVLKKDAFSKDFFPDVFLTRLFNAALFSMDITKQNGRVPQVGDNDNGRLFKLSPEKDILNHDAFISAVNGFFECSELIIGDNYPLEKSIIKSLSRNKKLETLVIHKGTLDIHQYEKIDFKYSSINEIKYDNFSSEKVSISSLEFIYYSFFGLYIYKSENFYLSIMAGGIGQNGVGGHGHNDKLSFELSIFEKDIIIDSGTYLYTALPEKRNMFRSIKAHNVPVVGEEEQCRFIDLFSMKDEVKCWPVSIMKNNAIFYLTYRDIKIAREFIIASDRLIIIDKCNKPFKVSINIKGPVSKSYGEIENIL